MKLEHALDFAQQRKTATLVTLRADGRPQSSDVAYALDKNRFAISVTDTRAKTVNLRRDARAVLHISAPDQWAYVSFDGTVTLTPVAATVDDPTVNALVDYYEAVAGGPHDDWVSYRSAMVDERRLLAWFDPKQAVGQIPTDT